MARLAWIAPLALGLALGACDNSPASEQDASADDIETIPFDDVPDASEDELDTGGAAGSESADGAGSSGQANGSSNAPTLIKGGDSTEGQTPPPGSKLQKADPN